MQQQQLAVCSTRHRDETTTEHRLDAQQYQMFHSHRELNHFPKLTIMLIFHNIPTVPRNLTKNTKLQHTRTTKFHSEYEPSPVQRSDVNEGEQECTTVKVET